LARSGTGKDCLKMQTGMSMRSVMGERISVWVRLEKCSGSGMCHGGVTEVILLLGHGRSNIYGVGSKLFATKFIAKFAIVFFLNWACR
jgi:hypothetical protein